MHMSVAPIRMYMPVAPINCIHFSSSFSYIQIALHPTLSIYYVIIYLLCWNLILLIAEKGEDLILWS